MRRATAKSTERSPAIEPGFQCRLGLPSAWSQPETRRTTLVRSHSHTSATSLIPLLPRVLVPSPTSRYSRLARTDRALPSFLSCLPYRARLREIFLVLCDRQMRAGALCGLLRQVVGSFKIRFALLSFALKENLFFHVSTTFRFDDESTSLLNRMDLEYSQMMIRRLTISLFLVLNFIIYMVFFDKYE